MSPLGQDLQKVHRESLVWDYEQEYGPLTNFGSACIQNPNAWLNTPWPWEKEANRED